MISDQRVKDHLEAVLHTRLDGFEANFEDFLDFIRIVIHNTIMVENRGQVHHDDLITDYFIKRNYQYLKELHTLELL